MYLKINGHGKDNHTKKTDKSFNKENQKLLNLFDGNPLCVRSGLKVEYQNLNFSDLFPNFIF